MIQDALIAQIAAATGTPAAELHTWLAAPPRMPGWTQEEALHARLRSLESGPMPDDVAAQLRRQVATTIQAAA